MKKPEPQGSGMKAFSCPDSWEERPLSWSSGPASHFRIWVPHWWCTMLGLPRPNAPGSSNTDTGTYLLTHRHRAETVTSQITDRRPQCGQKVPDNSLLAIFLRFSTGLKWMVGMGQTICIGSASTRQEFFLSQPAPSRYRPRTNTPSWRGRVQWAIWALVWRWHLANHETERNEEEGNTAGEKTEEGKIGLGRERWSQRREGGPESEKHCEVKWTSNAIRFVMETGDQKWQVCGNRNVTLVGSRRLLSSTEDTRNSQDSVSTDTCKKNETQY